MIVEAIINLLILIIKLPLQAIKVLNIPQLDISDSLGEISAYIASGASFIRFFFTDVALSAIGIALSVIVIFKVIDIISTIVGFFKKTGGSKD